MDAPVLILGASGGIGRALALTLDREGRGVVASVRFGGGVASLAARCPR